MVSKCPTCGSDRLHEKTIDHVVKGGNNTAFVEVTVEACEKCGETLFTPDQVRLFEKVKSKLENNQTEEFVPVGKNFRLA